MTSSEIRSVSLQQSRYFELYNGEVIYGLLIDTQTDPTWWIVTSVKDWQDAGCNSDEKSLEQFGRCINRLTIKYVSEKERSYYYRTQRIPRVNYHRHSKKLAILGAGASFNYDYEKEPEKTGYWPPLANNLFDSRFVEIIKKYPGVQAKISSLRLARDIEAHFQRDWDRLQHEHSPEKVHQLISIQYYLVELLKRVSIDHNTYDSNNYDILMEAMYNHTRQVNEYAHVVTFNYDTLLEGSAQRIFRLSYNEMDDYMNSHARLFIYKPHGSVNWYRKLNQTLAGETEATLEGIANWLYKNKLDFLDLKKTMAMEDSVQCQPLPIDPKGMDRWKAGFGEFGYPELLIPYNQKDQFAMTHYHLQFLTEISKAVTDILVIGWKGGEQKFMELLATATKRKKISLTIVDPNQDVLSNLKAHGINAQIRNHYRSFSEFVRKNGPEIFYSE